MDKKVRKAIIITSIFPPTEAIYKFASYPDYQLIVVGDKKTPLDWYCENVTFLSIEEQEKMNLQIQPLLPYNHYGRKMLGYLLAIQKQVEYIVDTDDDNIPKPNWGFPKFEQSFNYITDNQGFVNIYQYYTEQPIWARGLPLNLITKKFDFDKHLEKKLCNVGIWQGLADEDPDVDAIYRLTNNTPCYFKQKEPVVLGKNTISPFNSQNTLIRKELFPLLYLPTYVTFRFTDILRGLIAQPIMWLYGYHLGFTNATVIQKRNPHDYMKDFISEIPMYQYAEEVVEITIKSIHSTQNIYDNLHNAYVALLNANIVSKQEITTLEAWIQDLQNLNK
ncbi:MAG: STELLO glycosyltransferase family protein [Microscillaceae bacterium]|nr:STELLO glycosyltransferase family protein [Microscillaceae bacterium]MDW8460645.1 STELLO glycosyltransferase family protein [Cytophagales bacterium]